MVPLSGRAKLMRASLASTSSVAGPPPATPAHTAQETVAGKLAELHDRHVPAGTTVRNALALILLAASVAATTPSAAAANIVLLVLDDGAASDAAGMPTVQQLAREGATFDHAYTPSPMCAPGRAILQSGLYSQNNGVTQNSYRQFVASGAIDHTFAVALHNAGVDTRFVGKYINGS